MGHSDRRGPDRRLAGLYDDRRAGPDHHHRLQDRRGPRGGQDQGEVQGRGDRAGRGRDTQAQPVRGRGDGEPIEGDRSPFDGRDAVLGRAAAPWSGRRLRLGHAGLRGLCRDGPGRQRCCRQEIRRARAAAPGALGNPRQDLRPQGGEAGVLRLWRADLLPRLQGRPGARLRAGRRQQDRRRAHFHQRTLRRPGARAYPLLERQRRQPLGRRRRHGGTHRIPGGLAAGRHCLRNAGDLGDRVARRGRHGVSPLRQPRGGGGSVVQGEGKGHRLLRRLGAGALDRRPGGVPGHQGGLGRRHQDGIRPERDGLPHPGSDRIGARADRGGRPALQRSAPSHAGADRYGHARPAGDRQPLDGAALRRPRTATR